MKRISGSVKVSREPLQKQALPDKRTDDPDRSHFKQLFGDLSFGFLKYILVCFTRKRCFESQRYFR